jgi:mercuric ion binding protein
MKLPNWRIATALLLITGTAWAMPQTVTLAVPSMNCPVCPVTVKKALDKVPGVSRVEVNYDQRLARVTFDNARTKVEALTDATEDAGYPSTLMQTFR